MSKVVRSVKNVTKGYSSVEIKVRNATSNDPWGPVGSDMAEIAQLTFNNQDFYQIMDMLDKRLNDKGKNWRHVLKSLKVLDYCLHEGSELVVTWARKNLYIIKTLREFQYVDEDGRDVGQNVRVSAKELTSLILDEERMRAERADRKSWKSRVTGLEDYGMGGHGNEATRPRQQRRQRPDEEDLEYKLAIEASKNEMEEERRRRERTQRTDDDEDLQKAIRLSKEEEELRRRELEEANANSLFDDTPVQPAAAQPTGWNQGYQQQGAVDWFGNLVDQQQPQNTGFLNSAYSQPTGMQPQQTGFQNGYAYNGFQQQQPTGFDQNFGQQPNYLQPQQTAYNMGNNPWGQQTNGFGQQQPLEQQNTLQPGSNNPWASNSGAHTTDSIKPMATGSNNPFASAITRPATAQPVRSTAPSLSTLQEQQTAQFNGNNSAFNPIRDFSQQSFQQSQPTQSFQAQSPQQEKPMDPHAARLNALLASGDGQDTFGNTGNLRIPAQHTAPGTFVNSAGAGATRLTQNQTGNNPFLNSQFTGMPQQTGFANPNQQRLMPAQTGPVGGFGGSPNPFGASFGQPQQQQQQQGSLIDL
ncbi:eh domain binding protein epsin 2 [Neofusicoccum parvum]|uniref:Eh domain binding protein epsin 2 n=2 Tax=Neofusicoccum parvum TaxID=310453 RepID=A0ACB5S4L5_9PEZI|nr:putative eh domain binding protein epsin 2 protein [Neofusicoccum parvum UCRNP2]GME27711.1 eh domain binding protein epsin 2 [Neofusicoccum parvum]GME66202.1 eh domain binding protein epsin 2 [Neofusicoccum parvum]